MERIIGVGVRCIVGCQQRQHCENISKEVCGVIPRTSFKDKRNTAQDNLPTIMMKSGSQSSRSRETRKLTPLQTSPCELQKTQDILGKALDYETLFECKFSKGYILRLLGSSPRSHIVKAHEARTSHKSIRRTSTPRPIYNRRL